MDFGLQEDGDPQWIAISVNIVRDVTFFILIIIIFFAE